MNYVSVTNSPVPVIQEAIILCMKHSVTRNGFLDKRVVSYDFPNLEVVPDIDKTMAGSYFNDRFRPVLEEMKIEPSVEIHAKEIVYAIRNNLPIELDKPGNGLRQRSDFTEQCKSFTGGFQDLRGKVTTMKFPSGEEFGFGVASAIIRDLLGEIPRTKPKVPSIPPKEPKHGIK